MHLPGRTLFWHLNADSHGRAWNTRAALVPHGAGPDDVVPAHGQMTVDLHPGTRWVRGATPVVQADDGGDLKLGFRPRAHLEMQGIGYQHPTWTHGLPHGELAVEHESIELTDPDPGQINRWHRQLLCDVEVNGADVGATGVLEHLVIGPYAPLGL